MGGSGPTWTKPKVKTKPLPNTTAGGELACAFGEPWMGPHPLCEDETDRACRQFDADVVTGKYDRPLTEE